MGINYSEREKAEFIKDYRKSRIANRRLYFTIFYIRGKIKEVARRR